MVAAAGLTSFHSAALALITFGDRRSSARLSLVVKPTFVGSCPLSLIKP